MRSGAWAPAMTFIATEPRTLMLSVECRLAPRAIKSAPILSADCKMQDASSEPGG